MTNKKLIYTASFFTYIIQGMVVFSLGLLMPYMMSCYSMDYSQGGSMIFFMLLGGLISSTFGGMLVNKLGEKLLIILGALCIAIGYSAMIFAESMALLYFLLYIVGTGTGIFNIALNSLAAKISNSNPKKINTLHIFYAVGAVFGTLLSAAIAQFDLTWKMYLYVAIFMNIVSICMFIGVKVDAHTEKTKSEKVDLSFFRSSAFYIFSMLTFLYVGIEIAINGWIVTFLNDSGIISGAASNYVLTILWVLIIAGRFINKSLSNDVKLENRLFVCSTAILLSYILFLNTSSISLLLGSVIILGLAMSAFYPNIIANSSEKIQGNPTALGLILSSGGLGGAVIPWINGIIADAHGIDASMSAIIFFIAILVAAAFANFIIKNRSV